MGTNPEPNHGIAIKLSNGPVSSIDAGRVNWQFWMNFFEPQTGMGGVLLKLAIGATSRFTDGWGEIE
jgi:hypothetical protein